MKETKWMSAGTDEPAKTKFADQICGYVIENG